MTRLALAARLARRELRGNLKGFAVFLACLALGVAVIAAVGSLSAAVNAGLKTDARALLGGDVDLQLAQRAASPEERRFLAAAGRVSEIARLRAMAVRPDDQARSLIELKAVDGAYPLYGTIDLAPQEPLSTALGEENGVWGAVIAPSLLDRLKLQLGDEIRIGQGRFVLRAVIAHEPDSVSGGFELGPRVIVSQAALGSTGLIVPGTLVEHAYRLRLPAGSDVPGFVAALGQRFPEAGWRIRSFADAAPSLQQLLDRLTVFLTLVGLTALLVGGVGIGNAVESYLREKVATIATLKCLGAPLGLVFATYLLQILVLSLVGIGLGVALGALAPYGAVPFLPAVLPVEAQLALYPAPLLLAAGYGLLATLVFASWPIGIACQTPPASLFRNRVEPLRARPGRLAATTTALAAAALAALALVTAADRVVALWFILGAAAALALFRSAAWAIMRAAALAGRPRATVLRLALANLYRPGAATGSIVASLGLGLAVLVAVALVHGNLMREIGDSVPQRAPSFFFIDIQPSQIADFDRLLASMPAVSDVHQVPSLRGRITA
ncbi:MAG: ABC transporter permease, partial [Stellaceae bacterium]